MSLRSYQLDCLSQIRSHLKSGVQKILVRMPTGAGKSRIIAEILKGVKEKGNHGLFIVRGKKLVTQISETVALQGVEHSVIMASDPDDNQIHVASIDTLSSRKIFPKADVIVLDEVHLCLSPAFDEVIECYPQAVILSFSATPFHKRGFKHLAEVMVEPVTVKDLIDEGFLVPARYFAPSVPDLSTVKKSQGDYQVKDLAEVMSQSRLMAPIVESWQKIAAGEPTLLFAVNVEHSKLLCAQFNEAGIKAEHIDANSKQKERDQAIQRLAHGSISILCNVGLLGTGFDLPLISTVIIARPTLSYPLWMQMIGRGTRPYPGKRHVKILDHAGNTFKHGYYETHRDASLNGKIPLVRTEISICERCYACFDASLDACPATLPSGEICGEKRPAPKERKKSKKDHDESLALTELTPEQLEVQRREIWIRATAVDAAARGFKPTYVFIQTKLRYGQDIAKSSWKIIKEVYG